MRYLYTSLFYLSVPLMLLRLWWRSRRAPAYTQRWLERFGFFAPLITQKRVVWIHTVSVGEFLGALPLIRYLMQNPELQLVITTTTPTGSERVKESLGGKVFHVYAPYDLPDCIARFLSRIEPDFVIIMETELWPNTIAACAHEEIPVILINARMSARSARGYQKFSGITQPMLRQLTRVGIQQQQDAERFEALGLPQDRSVITGNIKFDLTLGEDLITQARRLKDDWSEGQIRLIWIAASTHFGEDEKILDAFAQFRRAGIAQSLLLVLVPRHPERFANVSQVCEERGYSVARRSQKESPRGKDILLGDTMGELLLMYGASDIAFVGGSLVPKGGHNMIEPAAWGLPIISGMEVFNFAEVSRLLSDAGALTLVDSPEALADRLSVLVTNIQERKRQGMAARMVANANRGALEKTLRLLEPYL